jgi:hypothetical protein
MIPANRFASFVMAVLFVAGPACTPTRNYPARGSDGRMYQRILCRASTPGKCTARAQEICGSYAVVEPLHATTYDEELATMAVQCQPEGGR